MQAYFKVGNIYLDNKQFFAYKFSVSNIEQLINIIIPHFDKYPLMGSKQLDFLDWKKAIINYNKDKKLKKVLDLKEKMNNKRSFKQRWLYLNDKQIILCPEWIQAFVDGEGCFQCTIGNHKNRDRYILSIIITLEIAQNTHDVKLLDAIKAYFGKGYLKPKFDISKIEQVEKVRGVSRYVTHCSDQLIEFFVKYPLYTLKHKDYLDWKELYGLKAKNTHKKEDGLKAMIAIKKGMNKGRLLDTDKVGVKKELNLININQHK